MGYAPLPDVSWYANARALRAVLHIGSEAQQHPPAGGGGYPTAQRGRGASPRLGCPWGPGASACRDRTVLALQLWECCPAANPTRRAKVSQGAPTAEVMPIERGVRAGHFQPFAPGGHPFAPAKHPTNHAHGPCPPGRFACKNVVTCARILTCLHTSCTNCAVTCARIFTLNSQWCDR